MSVSVGLGAMVSGQEDRVRSRLAGLRRRLVKPVDPPVLEAPRARPGGQLVNADGTR